MVIVFNGFVGEHNTHCVTSSFSFEKHRVTAEQLKFVHFLLWKRNHRVVIICWLLNNQTIRLRLLFQNSSLQLLSIKIIRINKNYQILIKNIKELIWNGKQMMKTKEKNTRFSKLVQNCYFSLKRNYKYKQALHFHKEYKYIVYSY